MTPLPVLAADVGGTQMRAALVDHRGDILLRRSAATPGDADVPAALIDLILTVGAERAHGAASHAVVGLPGAVDYDAGRLLWAPHLPERWPDQLSDEELSTRLGLRAHIANDADLAAVGEAAFGAGAGIADVAYLTISTGIGAGVVHDGRLLRGRRSLAEVGHTVIDWRAWKEGLPSTLEELGSGSGLARMAREVGARAPRRPGGRSGGGGGRGQGDRPLGGRHRRLRRRGVQPRHVLLPERGRHRRRARPGYGLLRPSPRPGDGPARTPPGRPDDRARRLGRRRRPGRRRGMGRRDGAGLSAALTWPYAGPQALPSKGTLASIRFKKLQQNCNTPTPSG